MNIKPLSFYNEETAAKMSADGRKFMQQLLFALEGVVDIYEKDKLMQDLI